MRLLHYKASHVLKHDLPGMKSFRGYFRAYGYGVMPLDRSGVIRFPVRTQSLFPLPKMVAFGKSYEEVCNERALELLGRADRLDAPLYVFWSGGIDSTCVLVSLLKNMTRAQRERITVLMSEASINEYTSFYRRYIRGRLRCAPAAQFPYLLGAENMIVSGEHNDQLFGSDIIAQAIKKFGFDAVVASYSRPLLIDFFTEQMGDLATKYIGLFERLREGSPVPLKTNYDLLWWINFAIKWQNVFMRMLSFVAPAGVTKLTPEYVNTYYAPFFCTDDFQLWSMNNLDKRVRNSWRSYKWPAKDLIYEFTKDDAYRDNKLKIGSLKFLIAQNSAAGFIDDKFAFHGQVAPEAFYEERNDFSEG